MSAYGLAIDKKEIEVRTKEGKCRARMYMESLMYHIQVMRGTEIKFLWLRPEWDWISYYHFKTEELEEAEWSWSRARAYVERLGTITTEEGFKQTKEYDV